jgi:enoyl-CoA hydratase/carnithine racemase
MAQLTVERRGAVAICTITTPTRGCMDHETVRELDGVTQVLEADKDVRALVLTGGHPGVFLGHYSAAELEETSVRLRHAGVKVAASDATPEREVDEVFRRIETMAKPVLAALNGTALGGGFELALACDLRIAEAGDAAFGLPEVKVGLVPGGGGTQRLARLVGGARALELILRGRTVFVEEARALGIVQEVAPAGGALQRAVAIAEDIAGRPTAAVAQIKRLVRAAGVVPFEEGLAIERTLFLERLTSDDALGRLHEFNRSERDITEL